MDPRRGPTIPAINMQIRAADGSGADPHENLRGTRRGNGNGFELGAPFWAHLTQSPHRRRWHRVQAAMQQAAKFTSLAYRLGKQKSTAPEHCFRYNRGG